MYEFPLMVMGTIVFLTVVLPLLPVLVRKILVIPACAVLIFGLHYMILTPGWQGNVRHLGRPWNAILFALLALLIIMGAVAYLIAA